MTGCFPARYPKDAADLGFGDRVTITELLKRKGYKTGHFGKWHIEGSVNQRLREFWPEIPGCERNLEGPFRTPKVLSRNRERREDRQNVANPCGNWP